MRHSQAPEPTLRFPPGLWPPLPPRYVISERCLQGLLDGWMAQWIIPYLHPEIQMAKTACFGHKDFSMNFLSRFKMHKMHRTTQGSSHLTVAGAFNSGRKAFVNGRMRYISRVRYLDSASHWKHSIIRVVSNHPSSDQNPGYLLERNAIRVLSVAHLQSRWIYLDIKIPWWTWCFFEVHCSCVLCREA